LTAARTILYDRKQLSGRVKDVSGKRTLS